MSFEDDPLPREPAESRPDSFISPLLGDPTRPEYVETLLKLEIGANIIQALTGWRPPTPPTC
jgi:hypothetical protein